MAKAGRLLEQGFFAFEDLEIYRLSMDLAADVYRVTAKFPSDERFGLTNQVRRAATSVTLNIAEGRGRSTERDFARFLHQARGSLYEVVSGCHLAERLEFIEQQDVRDLYKAAYTLAAKISALAQKLSPT